MAFKWTDEYTCYNPIQKSQHTGKKKDMRSHISMGSKICSTCRLKLSRLPDIPDLSNLELSKLPTTPVIPDLI